MTWIIIFLIFTLIMIVVLSSLKKTNEKFYNKICGGSCQTNADCSSNFICSNNQCSQV